MEKTWKLYILKCRDGSLYTGITTDIEKRVQAHNSGKGAKYTRSRKPVELVYFRNCDDHSHALRYEMDVKKLSKEDKWKLINDALAHQ